MKVKQRSSRRKKASKAKANVGKYGCYGETTGSSINDERGDDNVADNG